MPKTPPVTKNLIIINFIMYFALIVGQKWGVDLNEVLGLHFFLAGNFQPYQLLTYMFMHGGFTHIFCNMFTLWMFGRIVENTLGTKRFLWLFLICGIGAGVCQEIAQGAVYLIQGLGNYQTVSDGATSIMMSQYLNMWTTVGASGACYGVLIAYGMLYPNERVMLLIPPIPMKAKYMVIGFIALDFFAAFGMKGDGVAHFAHLGGALIGFLVMLYWKKKQHARNSAFTSWEEYKPKKESAWTRFRNKMKSNNKEKNAESNQKEIDKILDKIKRSGYDSLTKEEKDKLFNSKK